MYIWIILSFYLYIPLVLANVPLQPWILGSSNDPEDAKKLPVITMFRFGIDFELFFSGLL